jgi:D-glycerate 3-kinase
MPDALAERIGARIDAAIAGADRPALLFVSGAQGIGKSTALAKLAAAGAGRIAALSIDDFYLPAARRRAIARSVHPLCATRGPPGTHELALLAAVLDRLLDPREAAPVVAPVFDKARDDRAPEGAWRRLAPAPAAVIVEGWLMGAEPDPEAPHDAPLNAVEAEDAGGVWRAWVEAHLAEDYRALWDRADAFVHLDAPSFDAVLAWRTQQEETTLALPPGALPAERAAWLTRFVQHFERVTRRMLAGRRRAGLAIAVDQNRRPSPF